MSAQVMRIGPKPTTTLLQDIAELFRHRDLLVLLVQKELKLKYKGTLLGVVWSLLNPLLLMAVYAVVFSTIVRYPVARFPIFLLAGLLPWTAFSTTILNATPLILSNGSLVRRTPFPVESLPISVVLSNLVNMLLGFVLLLIFVVPFRQPLGWPLLALPLLILLQLVFTTGIALAVSALTVYFRDLNHLMSIAVMVWFFGTPVLYPLSIFEGKRAYAFLRLNPMAWLMDGYQRVWHANSWPDGGYLLAFALVSVTSLLIGSLVFKRLARRFAEEV